MRLSFFRNSLRPAVVYMMCFKYAILFLLSIFSVYNQSVHAQRITGDMAVKAARDLAPGAVSRVAYGLAARLAHAVASTSGVPMDFGLLKREIVKLSGGAIKDHEINNLSDVVKIALKYAHLSGAGLDNFKKTGKLSVNDMFELARIAKKFQGQVSLMML